MSRSRKLEPVIEMAQRASEEALSKLGELNAVLQQHQLQLDDLLQYRADYLARFRRDDPLVMSAKKALDLRSFLVKLDQAVSSQEGLVRQASRQVETQRQHWLKARSKEQALAALMNRYDSQERQKQLKKEQADTDEFTNNIWLRNRK
ncbi:MAG TPA: flagellar export protein FliJ [Methylophaga aminisulfidivorans]|uniref:Flagellar FliJ protein n=2 Tax=root TaxID=1 RepID=A0A7C1ZSI8_9GAMM|nr:flagellar export protein FliJ [Methylophaga aminisulfidivorans]HEC73069.1 flagellar export protein FliJ [Methylophaga aminisulfidivorans]